jgi:hypothetical protein
VSIATLQYHPERIAELRQQVRARMLRESPCARQPNFIRMSAADLLLLWRLYNDLFFAGALQGLLTDKTHRPLTLKVSQAMTSSGGRTLRVRRRDHNGDLQTHYEIAISARLLFNSFKDNDRPIHVSGQLCTDRLDAMMRIMEHELVHLIEMLSFGDSSCRKTRFLTIADRLFGHTHAAHHLITPRERAAAEHKLRPGDDVEFSFEGQTLRGRLNRVNTRATVLVPDPRGLRYTDGNRYARYYVPLSRLAPARPSVAWAQTPDAGTDK